MSDSFASHHNSRIGLRWALIWGLTAVGAMSSSGAQKPLKVGGGPPQFPADPRMMITDSEIQARLTQIRADVAAGKMYSGKPLVLQGPFRATLEWRNAPQKSINEHEDDAELFVVIEGDGAITLGGHLVNPHVAHTFPWETNTLTAESVEGATVYKVHKGDVILIPPKTPHAISAVEGELALWSMHLPMDARHAVPSEKKAYARYIAEHPKAK